MPALFAVVLLLTHVNAELCPKSETEQAIIELHDDLDDDDDGSISSTENNEFITEYGLSSSGSIAAMIGDSDGRISPAEFLTTWKRSEVYRWSATDVIEWLKGPELKLSQTAQETLSKIVIDKNLTGRCFPLISQNDQLLKKIGVRQHLVRRKLMLKAMDAILFGPPVYDNTLKDFILILAVMIAIGASMYVMQLRRQNSRIEAQLSMEHDRIQKLDEGWSDLDLNRQHSDGGGSSATDLRQVERHNGSVKSMADREFARQQSNVSAIMGTSSHYESGVLNEKVRLLLYTCYKTEKQQLSHRKEEALRIKASAKDAFDRLQKSNQSLIGSIRIIHSPTQLQSIDASIREATSALGRVSEWQLDFTSRWRKLERYFRCSLTVKEAQTKTLITTALTLTAAPVLKLDERFEEEEFQSSHEEEMSQLKTASEHSGLTLKSAEDFTDSGSMSTASSMHVKVKNKSFMPKIFRRLSKKKKK